MDPARNPYTPGAGAQPAELAGRDAVRSAVGVAIERVRQGRPAKSVLMVGLRGVGKTVLLSKMQRDAVADGARTISIEAPERRTLPAMLAPELRRVLLELSRIERAADAARRGLRALAGFARALKVKYQDIEVGIDLEPEAGLADNGDLQHDLQALFEAAGRAAQDAGSVIAIFIDELQYVGEPELEALITALHKCAQLQVPVLLVGAGLPQLRGRMGSAKSYAERMFDFPLIDALGPDDARRALIRPAEDEGVSYEPAAVEAIIEMTRGYPYFLQEWGKQSWDVAEDSPIRLADVEEASKVVLAALDEGFFRVRFDRLTPAEKRYLRAMAELGPGPHRSGDVAELLKKDVTSLGPVRAKLIDKGMAYSPSHGDIAFTVPLFDEYMRRTIPGDDWRA